jgi:hypothetical protein
VITGVNLTILQPAPFSSAMVSLCAFHDLTRLLRTGELSASFVPLMT